jgi:putative acetyltransferase
MDEIKIEAARSREQIEQIRQLFLEYARSLGFDLCFQDFQTELDNLPGEYSAPDGSLHIAHFNNVPAACVAMRRFGNDACEMKRLYVKPQFRKLGIGRKLAERVIADARKAGYERMLLDTIGTMTEAIALYKSLGFAEIESYRFNPLEGARYFELKL